MDHFTIQTGDYNIRPGLVGSHENAWRWLSKPGTWLDGAQRVAVAAEVRQAHSCKLCAEKKEALSPNVVQGEHDSLGVLNANQVGVIHQVATDSGRTSEAWCRGAIDAGMGEGEFVEISGIVAMVMMMDTFKRGMGLSEDQLPVAESGETSRYVSPGAKRQAAWVPITEPEDVSDSDGPMYPSPKAGYIYRALSSVPDSMRAYWDLANEHYIPGQFIYDFATTARSILRPQIELIAARVAALHQCAY